MGASRRIIVFGAALAALAAAGYWHWSPYLAMRSMHAAVKAGDAEAFNRHVDFPRLRESLKSQFAAKMAERVGESETSRSDAGRAGAALGLMLGGALVDRMVDALVSPEAVMRAMAKGQLQAPRGDAGAASTTKGPEGMDWVVTRHGFDQMVARARGAGSGTAPADQSAGFVFERSGFATWRLTQIRLPATR